MIKAGMCTKCGTPVWRTAVAQKDHDGTKAGTVYILWPMPTSVYAQVSTPTGYAPGIAYCLSCAPPIGSAFEGALGVPPGSPIRNYETAHGRYSAWYAPEKETFYRAWLRDHLLLDPADIEALMMTWQTDRGPVHANP